MKKYIPHFYVLTAATIWGVIGFFNRHLMAEGVTPRGIVLIRNLGGLLLMTLVFLAMDRSIFRIRWRHIPYFLCTGIASVQIFTLLYFSCQELCSLAVAAILLYTAPAFVVLMSAILWKEPVTKQKLTAMALAFLGCVAVSGIFSGAVTVTPLGLLLGLGSGFFYATYSIFARYALRHYQPMTVTYYTFVFAGFSSILLSDPAQTAAIVFSGGRTALLTLGLIVISTVLPFILYTKGLSQLESGKASILASLEPVVAALTGIIAFGEPLAVGVIIGLACILGSVYILR